MGTKKKPECFACRAGTFEFTGQEFETFPQTYEFVCNNCGQYATLEPEIGKKVTREIAPLLPHEELEEKHKQNPDKEYYPIG